MQNIQDTYQQWAETIDAVKSYDPTRGAALKTWVTSQLRPLSRYGASLEPIKSPELARRKSAEIHRIYEEMHDKLGRYPNDDELSDEVGVSKTKLAKLRAAKPYNMSESGYAESNAKDSGELADIPTLSGHSSKSYAFDAVYDGLGPREKVIIDWKTGSHGKDMLSNAEIATRLGVSPAFISQVSADIAGRIQSVIQNTAREGVV